MGFQIEEMRAGDGPNPFIDPQRYQVFVERKAEGFEEKLKEAQATRSNGDQSGSTL